MQANVLLQSRGKCQVGNCEKTRKYGGQANAVAWELCERKFKQVAALTAGIEKSESRGFLVDSLLDQ